MHTCVHIYFYLYLYFEKNNLPTSKSCNLVKEKKLTALENLSANFMSVVLPIYIDIYLTYLYYTRQIHPSIHLHTIHTIYAIQYCKVGR